MGKQVSDLYLVKDRRAMMQMNCNACHRYDRKRKAPTSLIKQSNWSG